MSKRGKLARDLERLRELKEDLDAFLSSLRGLVHELFAYASHVRVARLETDDEELRQDLDIVLMHIAGAVGHVREACEELLACEEYFKDNIMRLEREVSEDE